MKLLRLCLLLMLSVPCFSQQSPNESPSCPQSFGPITITTSGTPISVPNNCGALVANNEEVISGSPASMSVVYAGCFSTASPCTTITTNTSTTSITVPISVQVVYKYFLVTPTWSGGTNVAFKLSSFITGAVNPSGGGGGSGTVNTGTANQIATYASNGTAVSGDSLLTDNGSLLNYTGTGGIESLLLSLLGATSGTFTMIPPAVAGNAANPVVLSNSVQVPSGAVYQIGNDTGLSRDSAGVIDCGNAAAGNKSCTFQPTIVNAQTGYQIGGAATSGHYLRGNGTNYVDSTIQAADLPAILNPTTGFEIGGAAASGHYLRGNGTNYVDNTIQLADLPTINSTKVDSSIATPTSVATAIAAASGLFEGGWASSTPTGTQFFSAAARQGVLTAGAVSNFAIIARAITITSLFANVSAAEGAAATIAITLDTCTTSTCGATATTLATCTIGNSASVCSATGLSVAITAGQLIVMQTVQTGTGTAQVGGVGFTYN